MIKNRDDKIKMRQIVIQVDKSPRGGTVDLMSLASFPKDATDGGPQVGWRATASRSANAVEPVAPEAFQRNDPDRAGDGDAVMSSHCSAAEIQVPFAR